MPQTGFPIQLMHPLLCPAVHSEKRSVAAIRLVSQVDRPAALRAVVDSGADCVRLEHSANAGAQAIAEGADPVLLLYASAHYPTVKRYLSMPHASAMSRPLNFLRARYGISRLLLPRRRYAMKPGWAADLCDTARQAGRRRS